MKQCIFIYSTNGKQCTYQAAVDGYCIRHWWKMMEGNEEEVEIPL